MRHLKYIKTLVILAAVMGVCLFAKPADAFIFQDRISTAKSLAHYAMGQIYDLLGLNNRAILEYEKASQFDDSSYLIHLRLGTSYARLNMLREAVDELKLVAKLNPDDLQSHYLLALIYSTQKDYDNAALEYEYILQKFSKVEPQNAEIYGYLGQLYYSQRKYDQAITQFEKILMLEPENSDMMYLLGSLYLEVNNLNKAIATLKNSLKINPMHDGSLNTLGYLYAENDMNLDEAEELVSEALKISPDNGAYLDSLGWVYYKKGKYKKALEFLQKANAILEDPVIYKHLGDVYHKMNIIEEALKYWNLSLELMPDQDDVKRKINDIQNNSASQQGMIF